MRKRGLKLEQERKKKDREGLSILKAEIKALKQAKNQAAKNAKKKNAKGNVRLLTSSILFH
jgi:hypothetical protein